MIKFFNQIEKKKKERKKYSVVEKQINTLRIQVWNFIMMNLIY